MECDCRHRECSTLTSSLDHGWTSFLSYVAVIMFVLNVVETRGINGNQPIYPYRRCTDRQQRQTPCLLSKVCVAKHSCHSGVCGESAVILCHTAADAERLFAEPLDPNHVQRLPSGPVVTKGKPNTQSSLQEAEIRPIQFRPAERCTLGVLNTTYRVPGKLCKADFVILATLVSTTSISFGVSVETVFRLSRVPISFLKDHITQIFLKGMTPLNKGTCAGRCSCSPHDLNVQLGQKYLFVGRDDQRQNSMVIDKKSSIHLWKGSMAEGVQNNARRCFNPKKLEQRLRKLSSSIRNSSS